MTTAFYHTTVLKRRFQTSNKYSDWFGRVYILKELTLNTRNHSADTFLTFLPIPFNGSGVLLKSLPGAILGENFVVKGHALRAQP